MSVLVNFKICDNAKECSGIAVCPTGALSYNEEKETIEIDNSKCISCGLCEKECPIGAIQVARNQEEYEKIEKEIEIDERTTKDLFVDRYGAVPISDFFRIKLEELNEKINKDCIVLIEIYDSETAECLLKSIPIKELTNDLPSDTLYYKAESNTKDIGFDIQALPALLIFKKGELIGHIDGYYNNDNKENMLSFIKEIINN